MNLQTTKKPLALGSLIALVVGNMVGSGIFLLPSSMAALGSASLWSWLITILGSFLLAIVLSKMSRLVPRNGGPYVYSLAGFGNFIGFQTAYCHWIAIWIGNAALAVSAITYFSIFVPMLHAATWMNTLAAIVFIWIFTLINIRGIRHASMVQNFATVLKLIPILLLVGFGIWHFHPSYLSLNVDMSNLHSHLSTVISAASLTLWAFIGVESATIPYEHVENPERNIPLATLLGTGIAALVYIASSLVIMGMIPADVLANTASPFIAAAQMIFGTSGKWIMALGALISCLGALNGWTLIQGQLSMSAAEDNLFPKIFAKRNRFGAPGWGLAIGSLLSSVLVLLTVHENLVDQFQVIILMASFAALIPYLYSSTAQMIILKQLEKRLSLKAQLHFLVSLIASIYIFWALLSTGREIIFYGSILIFTSIALYAWDYTDYYSE